MNDIGTISASSAYSANANSVYSSTKVSLVREKPETSVAEKLSTSSAFPDEINDEVIISDEAKALLAMDEDSTQVETPIEKKLNSDADAKAVSKNSPQAQDELPPEQKQEIADLKARDIEVKAHEQAHIAAASGISVSAPSYDYQTGPDGKRYAIGGEVSISFTEGGNPASDINKAQTMKAAALAPAQPSSQDLSVARNADRMIAQFQEELSAQQAEQIEQTESTDEPDESNVIDEADKSVGLEKTQSAEQLLSNEKTQGVEQPLSQDKPQVSKSPINDLLGIIG